MSIKIEDLCPSFPSIDNATFRRKVYEACTLFATENYDVLRKTQSEDMVPSEKFYTLEDQVKDVKTTIKTSGPPKKKRTPIRKSSKPGVKKPDIDTDVEYNKDVAKEEKKASVRKTYPIIFNRNAKTTIDFIIGRFLWEVYSIEPDDCDADDFPDAKSETAHFILEHVVTDFDNKCNVSQLIINSVKVFQPNKIISNSHGLDKEIRSKFGEHLVSGSFANVSADYLTEFLKLLMIYFSNKFWLEKSQTVNIKTFDTVLRYIELVIPLTCNTVSNGLLEDIYNYDKLVNPVKPASDKDDNKSDKKSPKEEADKKKADKKPTKEEADKKPTKEEADKKPTKEEADKKKADKKPPKEESYKKKADKKPPKEESYKKKADSEDGSHKKVSPKRPTRSLKKNKSESDESNEESDEPIDYDEEYPQSE
jgi:hypothetical protein